MKRRVEQTGNCIEAPVAQEYERLDGKGGQDGTDLGRVRG
jgi:hypothetical protein